MIKCERCGTTWEGWAPDHWDSAMQVTFAEERGSQTVLRSTIGKRPTGWKLHFAAKLNPPCRKVMSSKLQESHLSFEALAMHWDRIRVAPKEMQDFA